MDYCISAKKMHKLHTSSTRSNNFVRTFIYTTVGQFTLYYTDSVVH